MAQARRDLADYCSWWPRGHPEPCYAPASLVLVRPSGETLGFSCAEHLPAWAARVRGSTPCSSATSGRRGVEGIAGRRWVGSNLPGNVSQDRPLPTSAEYTMPDVRVVAKHWDRRSVQ
jgi:hypothetical protein